MKCKKSLNGPIICFFDILRKITGGQLILTPVVGYALTTNPFARTGVVGAIAMFLVDFGMTFHNRQKPFTNYSDLVSARS